jgi:hypothetical protein
MLSVIVLNVVMLSVIMLNVVMLSVIMLNVVTLGVVLLNVVTPFESDNSSDFFITKPSINLSPLFLSISSVIAASKCHRKVAGDKGVSIDI